MPRKQTDGQYGLEDYRLPEARVKICEGPDTLFSQEPVSSPEAAARLVGDKLLKDVDREYLVVISLDMQLRPINYSIASIGTLGMTVADPGQIMKSVILSNSASFMVMHCHPSGDPTPSKEDTEMTNRMVKVGDLCGIPLVDHVVYGCGTGYHYSFQENGLMQHAGNSRAAETSSTYVAEKSETLAGKSLPGPKSVEEAVKNIKEGVEKYLQSDKWKQVLDTFARFHKYSLTNSLLIAMQNPAATQVASYTTWKTLGRWPEKGQHGMKIICPCPYRTKTEEEIVDENTGEKKKQEKWTTHMGWKLGTVFDVSQTDGKSLPEISKELQGEVVDKDLIIAAKHSTPDGISVETGYIEGVAKGYFSPAEREIRIREGMSEQQTLKTLCHELGHAYVEMATEKGNFTRQDKELQAESIAYTVCKHFGIDSSDYSFPYIASWSGGDSDRIIPNLEVIKRCSTEIIRCMDRNLEQVRLKRQTDGVYKTEYGYLDLARQPDGTWAYQMYNKNFRHINSGKTKQLGMRIDQAASQINMMHGYAGIIQPQPRKQLEAGCQNYINNDTERKVRL